MSQSETPATAPGSFAADNSIVIEGVRHQYKGGTVALDGVDLRIGPGLFGLLGPNGAGKSTLMRIVCTLIVPTQGRVQVQGLDIVEDRRKVRERIGYLPQEFGGWRLLRVEEVLHTLARMSGMTDKGRRAKRVAEVLASVGLTEKADSKVKKLSGGMVRRLGVAQALIHDPPVIVVDEPTVGLDPEERIHFRQLMTELGQDRIIVLSTHIVADLGPGCKDVALLDQGKIAFRGSPNQLVAQARGRVFEMTTAGAPVAGNFEEVSRVARGSAVVIRAVSTDGSIPSGGQQVENPSLEEAYLAFMAARGRSIAEEVSS